MDTQFTAFAGHSLLAAGDAAWVAAAAARAEDQGVDRVLIFDDRSGRQAELDRRLDPPAIAAGEAPSRPAARGRPRLGVTAREVTLLPRHWQWLEAQPGGASATLRRLVEQASRAPDDGGRAGAEIAYRVMSALGGDLPRFEDAARALFAGDREGLDAIVLDWPGDVAAYLQRLLPRRLA